MGLIKSSSFIVKIISMKTTLLIFFNLLVFAVNAKSSSVISTSESITDSTKFVGSLACAYGNESKIGILLPKFYGVRKHYRSMVDFYYGGSVGLHPLLITGMVTATALFGTEFKKIDLEGSVSQLRVFKIPERDGIETKGPFGQSLLNFKIGYRIKKVRIRLGYSWILAEQIPKEQERIPLLDIGKIGGNLYGLEVVFDL